MPSHLAYSPDSSARVRQPAGHRQAGGLRPQPQAGLDGEVGKTPAGVLWHNSKLLVANMGTDYVVVVDPVDGRVVERIQTGRARTDLFLSPDGKMLWVNNRVGGTTVALDAETLRHPQL